MMMLVTSCTATPESADRSIKVGDRSFPTREVTSAVRRGGGGAAKPGSPVIAMWHAPYADLSQPGGGFPIVREAEHFVIWRPSSRENGAFNHFTALAYHDGRFLVMWGSHTMTEDAPGQRVLWASSPDAVHWQYRGELFPAPQAMLRERLAPGVSLRPDRWAIVEGRCFAVGYGRYNTLIHANDYPMAREVNRNHSLGEIFLFDDSLPDAAIPEYLRGDRKTVDKATGEAIRRWYLRTGRSSWWAQRGDCFFPERLPRVAVDGATLIEPFTYRAADGRQVLMMRFYRGHNNRLYVSLRDVEGQWVTPHPTDIPDSPTRSEAVQLPGGGVLLIGSQIAQLDSGEYHVRDPLTVAVSADGYTFSRVLTLRHGAAKSTRFDGILGRAKGGFAYTSSLVRDGWLYTTYSINKEDIAITRVPLRSLGIE